MDQPLKNANGSHLHMKLLSNDQHLSIVKIESDSVDQSSGIEPNDKSVNDTDGFMVLHKLPNGEGLNLETLKKYDMGDIERGKMPEEVEGQEMEGGIEGMYDSPEQKG